MRGFIGCFILSMLLFMGWACAAPEPASAIPEQLAAANEQIAVLKAQNQALKEFQDGILSTLWSVIGVMVVVFGLFTYFQTKLSEKEVERLALLAVKPLRKLMIEYIKVFFLSIREDSETDPVRYKELILSDINTILQDMNLSPEEKDSVMDREFPHICREYISYIYTPLIPKRTRDQNQELSRKVGEFVECHWIRGGRPATPTHVREFFEGNKFYNAEIEENLKDYKYFYEHKDHRRFCEWKSRHERRQEASAADGSAAPPV